MGAQHLLDPQSVLCRQPCSKTALASRVIKLHMLLALCGIRGVHFVMSRSRLSLLVTGRHADARRSRLAPARRAAASPEPGTKRGTRAARTLAL